MAGPENETYEDWSVLDLDDALRSLADPRQPWDRDKAAAIVERLTHLGSPAGDPEHAGMGEMSVYHWGVVYRDCRAELREAGPEPSPTARWRFMPGAARRDRLQAQARELTVQARLRRRAYRAWVIRDMFREALEFPGDHRNVIAFRPGKGGRRK